MPKKQPQIVINSRDDADRALQRIGELQRYIEGAESDCEDHVATFRQKMLDETAPWRETLAVNEAALKAWAKADQYTWPAKSLELVFGTVGWRKPPAAIKLKLAIETIVERLRARRMHTCIRTTEEPDKEALAAYADDVLVELGCERTKPKDKFWYELKREELKG